MVHLCVPRFFALITLLVSLGHVPQFCVEARDNRRREDDDNNRKTHSVKLDERHGFEVQRELAECKYSKAKATRLEGQVRFFLGLPSDACERMVIQWECDDTTRVSMFEFKVTRLFSTIHNRTHQLAMAQTEMAGMQVQT